MNNKLTNKKREELYKAIEFFEELLWLFESKNKTLKLKDAPRSLRELIKITDSDDRELIKITDPDDMALNYVSPNPNIHFLIGVLPRLLKDEDLFPSNQSIINFAEEILDIQMNRQGKRSRYELIGMIVCETDTLTDNKLHKLVHALAKLTSNEEQLINLKKYRSNGNDFSWNETIQLLTEKRND